MYTRPRTQIVRGGPRPLHEKNKPSGLIAKYIIPRDARLLRAKLGASLSAHARDCNTHIRLIGTRSHQDASPSANN